MNPGETFENDCFNFLKNHFKNNHIHFEHKGGMDSTLSDIQVSDSTGKNYFYIEAKSPSSQSGQFVLFADENTSSFIYSSKNKTPINHSTHLIIEYMNENFSKFLNANTSGVSIDLPEKVITNWIIDYYNNKNVKFFITKNKEFIIFPTEKLAEYFFVHATFRTKKSGSSKANKKDIEKIKDLFPNIIICKDSKNHFGVDKKSPNYKMNFKIENFSYILKESSPNFLEIRKLSNTTYKKKKKC